MSDNVNEELTENEKKIKKKTNKKATILVFLIVLIIGIILLFAFLLCRIAKASMRLMTILHFSLQN